MSSSIADLANECPLPAVALQRENFRCRDSCGHLAALRSVAPPHAVAAQAPEPAQLTVYSPQTSYSVPLLDVNGQPYIGLVELLEPLGSVDARPDGKKYKLKFTPPGGRPEEAQFTTARTRPNFAERATNCPPTFVLQNGRGYVPLVASHQSAGQNSSATQALYHPAGRRCSLARPRSASPLELDKGNPSRLLVGFSSAVNPTIATEPGRVRLTFRREPVAAAGPDSVTFNDPLITGVTFSEHDGLAELDIMGTAPLMANFADGGKTIIVTAAPPPPPPSRSYRLRQRHRPSPQAAPATPAASRPQTTLAAPRFLVLIDPAHGGSDIGAAITPACRRRMSCWRWRAACSASLPAAASRPACCATPMSLSPSTSARYRPMQRGPRCTSRLHAANTGRGVHVFTSLLPAANALARKAFLPWDTAQAAFLDLQRHRRRIGGRGTGRRASCPTPRCLRRCVR